MTSSYDILYFGDLSTSPYTSLLDLHAEARSSPLVSSFLKSAFQELQAGLALLRCPERELFEGRDFVEILGSIKTKEIRGVALDTVLSCVSQLGWLLR